MAKRTEQTTSYGLVIVLCGTWPAGQTIADIERLTTAGELSIVGYQWTPYGAAPLAQRMAEVSEAARKQHKPDGPCQLVTLAPDRWLMVDAIA